MIILCKISNIQYWQHYTELVSHSQKHRAHIKGRSNLSSTFCFQNTALWLGLDLVYRLLPVSAALTFTLAPSSVTPTDILWKSGEFTEVQKFYQCKIWGWHQRLWQQYPMSKTAAESPYNELHVLFMATEHLSHALSAWITATRCLQCPGILLSIAVTAQVLDDGLEKYKC